MEVAPARTARLSVRAWEHVEPSLLFTVVLGIVAITGLFSLVGADARWLAALGSAIAEHHAIPDGVPFAAAPTAHWPNAIVAAELLFHGLESTLGDRGLMLAQMVAVGGALSVLSRDALAGGASAPATATALIVASLGALPSLVIARVQLFSLLLFPVLALAVLVLFMINQDAARWTAVALLAALAVAGTWLRPGPDTLALLRIPAAAARVSMIAMHRNSRRSREPVK